jgi:hypothetical protein
VVAAVRADLEGLFQLALVEGGAALAALLEDALGLDAPLVGRDGLDALILPSKPGHEKSSGQ